MRASFRAPRCNRSAKRNQRKFGRQNAQGQVSLSN
jgi:hypothetical protein